MRQGSAKLSVLMSTYSNDNPDFLQETFFSLSKQSMKACEVVLVEDGPLNPTLETVIEQFRQTLNIKSVKLAVNKGLGLALAIGLKKCSAPIVARMDTDDIAIPHRFKRQYEFLSSNPDVAILGGHITEFDKAPYEAQYKRTVKLTHREIVKAAWMRNPFNHMTVMFRKDAILNAGNYQHVPYFEDYDLWLRIIAAGYQCRNLDEVLVYARIGNGLLSRRSGWRYITAEFNAVRSFSKYNIIPRSALLLNVTSRAAIRVLPKAAIKIAYTRLRSKAEK
ncbi:glycosyltransferase [Pseudochrobactrum saccharolyticum]|uniref:Glycosyltransferase involved in cell wall biosynthesis n=1 Tax=Pseudochrobactrum saccharolyticum TaxID=354352 RepID=A0A7W8AIK3_9HYPH|nr:glycosyltransferase [Pseudochrobactrum saccharolyticum]KAB0538988.1 glycosyltransferase [Pseudochrobactrum saccharolyticum]MBB5091017.1 glycosyltransferase involved in cell wall biosynthesis [Pseudochrobactrum saccharolyticum]MDP8249726.1 glycosyltransferase [Pseudochrobactrum saccharolyticum]